MNIYTIYCRMLILAGITLLVLANLSQTATALERPKLSDCIEHDYGYGDDGKAVVVKLTNTCKESWRVKYFFWSKPETPHEQVLKSWESFIIHKEANGSTPMFNACPSTDNTLLGVGSYDALDDFQCAWR